MDDQYREVIPTALSREQLFELVSSMLPDLRWRRGESEGDGSRTVSGWDDDGIMVTFRFESDRPRETAVRVSYRSAGSDTDGPLPSRQALGERLIGEVLPAVRANRRPGLAEGVSIVADLQQMVMPEGEDVVTVSGDGDELTMRIEYTSNGRPAEVSVVFHGAVFHLRNPVPGRSTLQGMYSTTGLDVCELADLGPTPFLRQWLDDPANRERLPDGDVHHYYVLFFDAGAAHHIIARSFELVGQEPPGSSTER